MPLTPFMQKNLLDWVLGGGGVVSSPPGRWMCFATSSPTSVTAFDGSISRVTVGFSGAASPAGSASNATGITRSLSAVQTFFGWNLYDSSVGGTRIAYGTLAVSAPCVSGDAPTLSPGAFKLTLS